MKISSYRVKEDSTSVYLKCSSGGNGSFEGTVYGATSSNGTYSNRTYNGKKAPTYAIQKGDIKYMTNYNYETSAPYTKVFYDSKYVSYTTMSGVWSPDSI